MNISLGGVLKEKRGTLETSFFENAFRVSVVFVCFGIINDPKAGLEREAEKMEEKCLCCRTKKRSQRMEDEGKQRAYGHIIESVKRANCRYCPRVFVSWTTMSFLPIENLEGTAETFNFNFFI